MNSVEPVANQLLCNESPESAENAFKAAALGNITDLEACWGQLSQAERQEAILEAIRYGKECVVFYYENFLRETPSFLGDCLLSSIEWDQSNVFQWLYSFVKDWEPNDKNLALQMAVQLGRIDFVEIFWKDGSITTETKTSCLMLVDHGENGCKILRKYIDDPSCTMEVKKNFLDNLTKLGCADPYLPNKLLEYIQRTGDREKLESYFKGLET